MKDKPDPLRNGTSCDQAQEFDVGEIEAPADVTLPKRRVTGFQNENSPHKGGLFSCLVAGARNYRYRHSLEVVI